MKISAIIPTCETKYIKNIVSNFLYCDEIIIVGYGKDKCRIDTPGIKHIRKQEINSIPKAINCGIKNSKYDKVIWLDSFTSPIFDKKIFWDIGFFNTFFDYAYEYDLYKRLEHYYPEYEYGVLINTNCEKTMAEVKIIDERYDLMFEKSKSTTCTMLCVRNEEEIIEQCLDDIILYGDKIAIFDDGSYDKTMDLASKYKKIVAIDSNPKRYENIRTEGRDRQRLVDLAHAQKTGFLIFLDCDECFEDRFKTQIFKEMKNKDIKLYFYYEKNFWRNDEYCRIDTLFNQGLFGRLYPNFSNPILYSDINEHCGALPKNIPLTHAWFNNSKTQKKSDIVVRHYGFSTEERIIKKFRQLWEREKDKSYEKKIEFYLRLVDENKLELEEYKEPKYYEKTNSKKIIISGNEFGRSESLKNEYNDAVNNCVRKWGQTKQYDNRA